MTQALARMTSAQAVQMRRRRATCAAVLAFGLSGFGGAAGAQVIEIGASGEAVTYAGPAVFTQDGVRQITPTVGSSVGTRADVARLIAEAADRHHVSADLVTQVAWRESRFHQAAVSARDAVGVMQLTAQTARTLGVDRYDVGQNVQGGAAYLRSLLDRYSGDVRLTLAAYNAGPGAVARYRGVPPFQETQAYVTAILGRLSQRTLTDVTPILYTR